MASLNLSVDPCEDFYAYACGNWPQHHEQENYGIANMMQGKYAEDMEDIIEKHYPRSTLQNLARGGALEKALNFYYSCDGVNNTLDFRKFLEILKPSTNLSWPLIEELHAPGNSRKFRLRQLEFFGLLGKLHGLGLNNELVKVIPLYLDNGQLVVLFSVPDVQYMEMDHIRKVLEKLGFAKEAGEKFAEEIFETQNHWQMIYQNFTKSQDEEDEEGKKEEEDDEGFTLLEFRLLYPKFYKFLTKALPLKLRQEKPLLAFANENYYKYLLSLKWPSQDVRKFCNYLLTKFMMVLKREHSFGCRINVLNHMPFVFHSLYHKYRYQPQAMDLNSHISGMTKKIYKYFVEILNENPLNFNRRQLQRIQEKLANVSINVGNLPRNLHSNILEDFYQDIPEMDVNDYYRNHLAVKQHSVMDQLKCPAFLSCREDPDHIPYYDRSQNMITIPFGTLKPPLYDIHLHPLLLYSAFGTILGHELTHAIDPTSLEEWEDTFPHFQQKSEVSQSLTCMQTQHPTTSIDERIADFLGTRVAWRAYSSEYSGTIVKFSDVSWKKLFFLNLSQFFCVKRQDFDDEHDTPPMRLNQIVSNLKEFSETFQCPLGSKMNPREKCRFY
ncbi:endothelin-converting enzyme homolog [Musca domestica]|uniref:Neprilysin-1-like n=1 Tax=Musca domestica TaxID=7370 RepID=A0A1I8MQ45_MUSDO|nr:endothelin-converting enzyme homolog [Musca domestica]